VIEDQIKEQLLQLARDRARASSASSTSTAARCCPANGRTHAERAQRARDRRASNGSGL
jgi:hypothetical protein